MKSLLNLLEPKFLIYHIPLKQWFRNNGEGTTVHKNRAFKYTVEAAQVWVESCPGILEMHEV